MKINHHAKLFILLFGGIAGLVALTGKNLATKIRFGLEFRGGYEIYYIATPKSGKTSFDQVELLETAKMLRARVDKTGLSEPDIHIEGKEHIRLKLAGLTSLDEVRSLIGDSSNLPVTITEKYTQTVGSVLGATALHDTLNAGLIAIICMFSLLIFLYRGLGVIASFCTLVYLWILVAVFNVSQATLSLSAVVAFVLGIGVAADASIICFERVKELLHKGIPFSEALSQGFSDSFPTIRDANAVTALVMVALFIAGIGPIEGFSLTMLASIVVSIATNFYLVRYLSVLLEKSNLLSQSVVIGSTESKAKSGVFDFIGAGRIALLTSTLIICAGVLYYQVHRLNLDIDFTAGTALDIDVSQPITQDTATKIMTDAGVPPATVSVGGKDERHIAARFDQTLRGPDLQKIITAFKAAYTTVEYEENTADPAVAHDFTVRAMYALGAAIFAIVIFIGLRFSWSVALATVVSIVHDLLMVCAIFTLFKLEIDVTFIAALLTVLGYSLNDKIVIFGRIRENVGSLRNGVSDLSESAKLRDLINLSIKQTLGRSIYTVVTVVLASGCLYFFACEPLQMFSLAILLGLISGAYSSVFIASLFWLCEKVQWRYTMNNKTTRMLFAGTLGIVICTVPAWMALSSQKATAVMVAANATSSLGNLSSYEKIAQDTLKLVEAHNMAGAKTRIKDLETAWDVGQEKLKPMSESVWNSVDKAIDRALTQLRTASPNESGCKDALKALVSKLHNPG